MGTDKQTRATYRSILNQLEAHDIAKSVIHEDWMKYSLGIDVGSSNTHALIVDETGRCVGFGKSSGGNPQRIGDDGLGTVLQEATKRALEKSGLGTMDIAAAGFGGAGYDFQSDRGGHLQAISTLGLSCPLEVTNDGMNGLFAGATYGIGIKVTVGFSNSCRGRGRQGQEGRIVGNGPVFGEHGGAIEIVGRGLQMVSYAWIKRITPTVLPKIYVEAVGAKRRNRFDARYLK